MKKSINDSHAERVNMMMRASIFFLLLLLLHGCYDARPHDRYHFIKEISRMPKCGTYYEVERNSKGEKELRKINLKEDIKDQR